MFFYLANDIKEKERKKAEEEKNIKTIVNIVTKRINNGGRCGGNFRGGYWGGVRVLQTTEGDTGTTHINSFN